MERALAAYATFSSLLSEDKSTGGTPELEATEVAGGAEGAFEGTVWADTAWGALEKGHATSKPVPLITRLEKN